VISTGPVFLDGWPFHTWNMVGLNQLDILAQPDDVAWAASRIGQYVAGEQAGQGFRAYIYSVHRPARQPLGTINILVEWP
jgi:hypothetical protein